MIKISDASFFIKWIELKLRNANKAARNVINNAGVMKRYNSRLISWSAKDERNEQFFLIYHCITVGF